MFYTDIEQLQPFDSEIMYEGLCYEIRKDKFKIERFAHRHRIVVFLILGWLALLNAKCPGQTCALMPCRLDIAFCASILTWIKSSQKAKNDKAAAVLK